MQQKRNGLPARHELKYFINPAELEMLRARLRPALAAMWHTAEISRKKYQHWKNKRNPVEKSEKESDT